MQASDPNHGSPGELPYLPPAELERLSQEFARTHDPELRETLILCHQRLVRSIAARFINSGEALDDLIQVGNIGLINALDRFSTERGTRFSTYATPTILGEIRRYFRDKANGIRLPRWMQEVQNAARRARHDLTHLYGRTPSSAEIAAHLDITEDQLLIAIEASEAVNLLSLDSGLDQYGTEAAALLEVVGARDRTLSDVDNYSDLRAAMDSLTEREREVIVLRFFEEVSQARIAEQLEISQMHVSRLQQRALKRLREHLSEDLHAPVERRRPIQSPA